MTKARKAPAKKIQKTNNQGIKIASALFVLLGVLVVLSMVLSSVFTQTPQPVPVATLVVATPTVMAAATTTP